MTSTIQPRYNTPRYTSTSDGLGVDTIRVRGPVVTADFPTWWSRSELDYPTGEIRTKVTHERAELGDGTVLILRYLNGQRWVWIERSVPTALHGHNCVPVPVHVLHDWVIKIHALASDYVDWIVAPSEMTVTRLDLVRDFREVYRPSRILDALYLLPVSHSNITERWANPALGGAQSLVRGTQNRWRATGYDKAAQVASLARKESDPGRASELAHQADLARGQLRVEVSTRRPYLKDKGIHTMADITETSTEQVRRELIQRAQFLAPVRGADAAEEALRAMLADPRDKGVAMTVFGWLSAHALGVPTPESETTRRLYRQVAAKHGISVADFASSAGSAGVRLDYDVGKLVAA